MVIDNFASFDLDDDTLKKSQKSGSRRRFFLPKPPITPADNLADHFKFENALYQIII